AGACPGGRCVPELPGVAEAAAGATGRHEGDAAAHQGRYVGADAAAPRGQGAAGREAAGEGGGRGVANVVAHAARGDDHLVGGVGQQGGVREEVHHGGLGAVLAG